ncbi:MAG TPA: hypothetical protein VEV41_04555 [Terriglobales bacterium]|nr:hypothetical protein [Terriglobales bacterium]
MIYLAEVNFGGVFEDEAADIFLAYEIDVAVLLLPTRRAANL